MCPSTKSRQAAASAGACGSMLATLKALLSHPFNEALWSQVAARNLHLRIGNEASCTSTLQSLERLRRFVAQVELPEASFCEVWKRRETIFAETELLVRSASCTPRPCVVIVRTCAGRIVDIRIHGDFAPGS